MLLDWGDITAHAHVHADTRIQAKKLRTDMIVCMQTLSLLTLLTPFMKSANPGKHINPNKPFHRNNHKINLEAE
jgi:hypothetical protein